MITLEMLEKITEGKLINGKNSFVKTIEGFEFNSRKIKKGKVFIPLEGKRDGHNFIEDAAKNGALATLTSKKIETLIPQIAVKDTLNAFVKIANFKRKLFKGKTVAITGSVGKTTTKELLSHVLSNFFTCKSNIESYNNMIGVSYTLSNLKNPDIYIQEIGTSAPGEIRKLTNIVKPEIAILTTVSPAHLEGFENIEALKEEKLSIFTKNKITIAPVEFKNRLKNGIFFGKGGDASFTEISSQPNKTVFKAKIMGENIRGTIKIPGKGILNSILIILIIAKLVEIDLKKATEILESFTSPKWRMEIRHLKNTILIKDFYNANPASMKNAIDVLANFNMPKVAIFGEMLELGKNSKFFHEEIGKYLNEKKVETGIFFGENSIFYLNTFNGKGYHFKDKNELIAFLKKIDIRKKVFLIKGSRGNRLEEVTHIIEKRLE